MLSINYVPVKNANQISGNEKCKALMKYANASFVEYPHWPASQPYGNSPPKINAVYLIPSRRSIKDCRSSPKESTQHQRPAQEKRL
jgi:hypothetical protein